MRFKNNVGPQVRRRRCARGWSQSVLAAKLQIAGFDISRSGVSKIEPRLSYVDDKTLSARDAEKLVRVAAAAKAWSSCASNISRSRSGPSAVCEDAEAIVQAISPGFPLVKNTS